MTELVETLRNQWTRLESMPSGGGVWRALRTDISHPLAVYTAIREEDLARSLLLEVPAGLGRLPAMSFESQGVSLEQSATEDHSGQRTAIVLARKDLSDVFEALASDLIATTADASGARDALSALGTRLWAWQACLKQRGGMLSGRGVESLVAEIWLLSRLAPILGPELAVDSWAGPEHAARDFRNGTCAIEVKAIASPDSPLFISSLEQLETTALTQLTLASVLVSADPEGDDLTVLVTSVRSLCGPPMATARRELERKLLLAGYLDADSGYYRTHRFARPRPKAYRVVEGFPRITRDTVPRGVATAIYSLETQALKPFLLDERGFEDALERFGTGR